MSPVNVPAIGSYIREQREQAKISLRQLAQAAGVSNPYLSQIERGLRRPSADILQQIARGLRISAEALYVQAGFLEDRPPGPAVRDAVLADPELTERQKQMLLEVYDSFRKEAASPGTRRCWWARRCRRMSRMRRCRRMRPRSRTAPAGGRHVAGGWTWPADDNQDPQDAARPRRGRTARPHPSTTNTG